MWKVSKILTLAAPMIFNDVKSVIKAVKLHAFIHSIPEFILTQFAEYSFYLFIHSNINSIIQGVKMLINRLYL